MGAAAAAADGSGVAAVRASAAADDRCVADVRASAAADDDDGRGAAAAKGRGGGQHDEFECNGTRKIESDTPICRRSYFMTFFRRLRPFMEHGYVSSQNSAESSAIWGNMGLLQRIATEASFPSCETSACSRQDHETCACFRPKNR